MTDAAPRHLFVYGTLMRGAPNAYAKLLAARAKFVSEAWARGRLYRLGHFPGAIFGEECPANVHGELFLLNNGAVLAALDAYEGCGDSGPHTGQFRREAIRVHLARGGTLAAWAYPFAGEASGRPVIASGRWPR